MKTFGWMTLFAMAVVITTLTSRSALATAYAFDIFDAPIPGEAQGLYINDDGVLAGVYGGGIGHNGIESFIYSHGTYTTIEVPVPGSAFNTVTGINNAGQVVGQFEYPGGYKPFLYTGGTYTIIPLPPGATIGGATGINNAGQITLGTDAGSFLDTGGILTSIDLPGSDETDVSGLNDRGEIIGEAFLNGHGSQEGFVDDAGVFTTISVPNAIITVPYGINDRGQIAGDFVGPDGPHGFVDTDGVFTVIDLDIPDAVATNVVGINNRGQISGEVQTTNGSYFFVGTPTSVPEPPSIALVGAVLFGFIALKRHAALCDWRPIKAGCPVTAIGAKRTLPRPLGPMAERTRSDF